MSKTHIHEKNKKIDLCNFTLNPLDLKGFLINYRDQTA